MLSKKLVDEVVYNEKGNDVLLVKYLNLPPLPLDQAPRSA
jgi:hypothetical protein